MSQLIVRCSSIGRLMAKPENADIWPDLITPELDAIIRKTKRTEGEKALLDEARRVSLSAGGRAHVRELVREAIYGYEPAQIQTRPILKGIAVESACIEMLSRLLGRPLAKNAERRTNGVISGECDVYEAAPLHEGRDVKAPYSMESMPIVLADAIDSGYEWQMRGYMKLWGANRWHVDYLLVSTPEDLVGFEPPALHYVDHIEERLRWTCWTADRNSALESLIDDKVAAARRYYREVMNEFDRTHGGRLPSEAETAARALTAATAKTTAPDANAGVLAPTF